MDDLRIEGVQRWDGGGRIDIVIAGERIRVAAENAPPNPARQRIEGEGLLVSPAFVEPHYHLDKVLVTEGARPGASFEQQVEAVARSKRSYSVASVAARARTVAEAMVRRGIGTIRTFADVDSYVGLTALDALLGVRQDMRPWLDLQIVAFPQHGLMADPGTIERMEEALCRGADLLGGHPQLEASKREGYRHIETLFELAQRYDCDLDFHVDENDDPQSCWLEAVVDATLRHGWIGRVNVAHCAALIKRPDAERHSLYARLREAQITVVSSPSSALLFRGHGALDPTRGIVPVRELLAEGIGVACAQEVYRSIFAVNLRYPDPLYTAQLMAYVAKLSDEDGLQAVWRMITETPATSLGIEDYGIAAGCSADLVLLKADSVATALTQLSPNRIVLHRGKIVAKSTYQEELCPNE